MAVVGIVVNPDRPNAATLADETASWLASRGHESRRLDEPGTAGDLDAVLSLGGDGTILHTVSLLDGAPVPIIGVNLGTLGYLSEVEPSGLLMALERFMAGDHGIEERMLLEVTVRAADADLDGRRWTALNEAVLERRLPGHGVRLDVAINSHPFTPYETDGFIVATPTGSTAYSLSARGPIVAPTHRALLLTPVAPHMLFDRSLILEPESLVTLTVSGRRQASLVVDGRDVATLEVGDAITCTAAVQVVRLATFAPRDFHRILKAKFGLSDR
ncbi:MAG: NAD(+)/NADH kinase [Acidimicrobiales bacterium]